jgi:hypothetical protein
MENLMTDNSGSRPRTDDQATDLVLLGQRRYRFGQTDNGHTFAVRLRGPNLVVPLRGRNSVKAYLGDAYFKATGRAASTSAIANALNVIEGRALGATREPVALRVGRCDEGIVIDLGTSDGRAVVLTGGTWQIAQRSPLLFRRTELTGQLPDPIRGGSLDELRALVNVADTAWGMLVGVLVCWLLPDVPRPVVLLVGEHGTGKTTAARSFAALIDPSPAPVRGTPRDLTEWVLSASGSWVVVLDNLSAIPDWLSDAVCRASTGEGMVRRALYTDDGLTVTSFRRNVMLTTIDAGALRGDLADRLVTVELDVIDPADRRRDDALAEAFLDAHPRVFGALLDLTAEVLAVLPGVNLDEAPRMADFAHVLAALDAVTGWHVLDSYRSLGASIAFQVVEGDVVARAVLEFAQVQGKWTGTATELLLAITPERIHRDWPQNGRALSGRLRRAAPPLRVLGVSVVFNERDAKARTLTVTFDSDHEPTTPS